MLRPLVVLFLACALSAQAGDEEGYARGRKYLDKVAKAWAEKLPEDRVLGLYLGRKWAGTMKCSVKAAPPDSGAAYELECHVEWTILGKAVNRDEQVLLGKDLALIGAKSRGEEAGRVIDWTLTVERGRWKLHAATGEPPKAQEGELKRWTTWCVPPLVAFVTPDDPELLLDSVPTGGGKVVVTRAGKSDGHYLLLRLADDGRLLEMQSSVAPLRMRPMATESIGKDLQEELNAPGPVRVVIDLYVGIKKDDRKAAMATIDLERMGKEQGKAVETLRTEFEGQLFDGEIRGSLPDADVLPDLYATVADCKEEGDLAEVKFEGGTFKLYRATEGDHKGSWLIYDIK